MAVTTITTKMVAGVKYTVQTDSSADWGSVSNSTYFYDKATEIVYYKDANGLVIDAYAPATPTSQAQILYVDSEFGTDTPTSGDLSKPFLTPEYALTQINNTGTITGNTNTNTTISGISDLDNANLEVGMYLSGTGIPFGTIIVAKGNQGGNANTVTLSKSATATASGLTLTWVKIYELRLAGNFIVTSNLFKEGVYINSQTARVSWGAFTLFNLGTTVLKTPYSILGEGDYFGTATTSMFFNATGTQLSGYTCDIKFNNIESVGTGNAFYISTPSYNNNFYNIKGNFVNCLFGTIGYFVSYGGIVDMNGYGLLGGIAIGTLHTSSTSTAWSLRGNYETPLAVNCLTANQMVESIGNIYGNTIWTYSSHTGKLRGTTHTLSAGNVNITSRSSVGLILGSGNVTISSGSSANIRSQSGTVLFLYGSGYSIEEYSTLDGTIYNFGSLGSSTNTAGTTGVIHNYGIWNFAYFNTTFSGTIHNYGEMYLNAWTSGNAIKMNNYGKMYVRQYSITLGNNAKLVNKGVIETYSSLSNTSAVVVLNHANAILDNFGTIENKESNVTKSVIEKTAGTLYLRQGSYVKVSNGKSPIRCTANTSASKDVYYFGVTDNCDGTTYGLLFAFDGSSFAPNDLAGGTLFENVNY